MLFVMSKNNKRSPQVYVYGDETSEDYVSSQTTVLVHSVLKLAGVSFEKITSPTWDARVEGVIVVTRKDVEHVCDLVRDSQYNARMRIILVLNQEEEKESVPREVAEHVTYFVWRIEKTLLENGLSLKALITDDVSD